MTLNPNAHADIYGPRSGDRVRLGDTGLVVQVEAHSQPDDDEFLLGFGKTGRDGIGLRAVRTEESCDVVDGVDGDTCTTHLTSSEWIIRVDAQQCGHVECRREAGNAVSEELAEACVGVRC